MVTAWGGVLSGVRVGVGVEVGERVGALVAVDVGEETGIGSVFVTAGVLPIPMHPEPVPKANHRNSKIRKMDLRIIRYSISPLTLRFLNDFTARPCCILAYLEFRVQ